MGSLLSCEFCGVQILLVWMCLGGGLILVVAGYFGVCSRIVVVGLSFGGFAVWLRSSGFGFGVRLACAAMNLVLGGCFVVCFSLKCLRGFGVCRLLFGLL